MLEENLLKILIKELIIEENLKQRSMKGYNATHPVISHKPFMMGLGRSDYEYEDDIEDEEDKSDHEPVKISRAFDKDDSLDYENILKELLNAKNLS